MVLDNKPYTARQYIFRTLEFGGELAVGSAAAYGGAGAIKASALATGVVLPALSKLYPDPVPAYLQNIVNYSMPDLVKVKKHDVTPHKYLFFSKGNLQAVIPDPMMLGIHEMHKTGPHFNSNPSVVYLSFDTLEIPFENVVGPGEESTERVIARLLSKNQSLIESVRDLEVNWTQSSTKLGRLTFSDYQSISNLVFSVETNLTVQIAVTSTNNNAGALTNLTKMASSIAKIKEVITALSPQAIKQSVTESSSRNRGALLSQARDLDRIRNSILSGTAGEFFQSDLKDHDKSLLELGSFITYFSSASSFLSSPELRSCLVSLAGVDSMGSNKNVTQISQCVAEQEANLEKFTSFNHIGL